MGLDIGGMTLSETTDNNNFIIRATAGAKELNIQRVCSTAAANTTGFTFPGYSPFAFTYNYNTPSGYGMSADRYTAPYDGVYLFQCGGHASTANQSNKYYDLRLNGSVRVRSYSSSGGSGNRRFPTGMVMGMSKNDYVQMYVNNVTLAAFGYLYFKMYVLYIG